MDSFRTEPQDWDAATDAYARIREPLTLPYGLDTLEAVRVGPGERLLDLAAGTGGVALAAARRGAEVVAVDSSSGMMNYLAARVGREGVGGVTARVMEGHSLDLPTDSFDAACSVFGVMFFPAYRAGLAELRRALKPGGRVGVTVWAHPSRMEHLAGVGAGDPVGRPGLRRVPAPRRVGADGNPRKFATGTGSRRVSGHRRRPGRPHVGGSVGPVVRRERRRQSGVPGPPRPRLP